MDQSAGIVINNQAASFGPGATVAGHDATGGTVTITPEAALGDLAAVIAKLQELRPGLQGAAAEAADRATQAFKAAPAADAPADMRRAWVSGAGRWLGRLLVVAPQAKAAVELGKEILKGLNPD